MKTLWLLLCVFLSLQASAGQIQLPLAPSDDDDPGSLQHLYARNDTKYEIDGRHVLLSMPNSKSPVPLIVLFKGQGAFSMAYNDMTNHLTGKGIGVLLLDYATNFFDGNYPRMANDCLKQIEFVLRAKRPVIDTTKLIWVGVSKGALVQLFAMTGPRPPALALLFSTPLDVPPPFEKMNSRIPVSFFVGDRDTRTPLKESMSAYQSMPASWKQLVIVSSYTGQYGEPRIDAVHHSFSSLPLLGRPANTLHYFAYWRYVAASAMYLEGSSIAKDILFGNRTRETALPQMTNQVLRSVPFPD